MLALVHSVIHECSLNSFRSHCKHAGMRTPTFDVIDKRKKMYLRTSQKVLNKCQPFWFVI